MAGDANFPYDGCYVDATITLWTQNSKDYGNRINGNLRGIRFRADGEEFGRPALEAEEEFDELPDDGDDDDFLND